jgi:Pretoxin HINT domain
LPVVVLILQLHHSCFGAGTLIQTMDGPRKIESIREGDRVLSQDTSTGELAFKSVLATHLNGPAETFRIAIDGETIVATGIHRFWKAGTGWTMARDLKAGDQLRILDGIVAIKSIKPDANQMVYNLTVAENRTFMVGAAGLLVHDYSFVQPVSEPFDRQPHSPPAKAK